MEQGQGLCTELLNVDGILDQKGKKRGEKGGKRGRKKRDEFDQPRCQRTAQRRWAQVTVRGQQRQALNHVTSSTRHPTNRSLGNTVSGSLATESCR